MKMIDIKDKEPEVGDKVDVVCIDEHGQLSFTQTQRVKPRKEHRARLFFTHLEGKKVLQWKKI